jgi:hypothetical protein
MERRMNELFSQDIVPTETRIAYLRFDQIDQNPFRDLVNNPLQKDQIEGLAASVRSTGFWHNVLVRPHSKAKGRYQLAYGHGRIEAARVAGLSAANFTVCDLDDETMLRMQTDENITQFGKDRFATYKEATVAAATFIMRAVLAGSAEKFFRTSGQGTRADLIEEVRTGGCPGREIITDFYRGTLNSGNIQAALKIWHDTGELAAWHRAHNPKAKPSAEKPTIDPETLRRFSKTDHVRTFAEAVQDTKTPVEEQARVADRIFSELAPPPKRSRSGREEFQEGVTPDTRFNSRNIRSEVIKAAADRTRSAKQKERFERLDQMTSLEQSLRELSAGLSRSVHGFQRIQKILEMMNGITEEDMTETARRYAREAAEALSELQGFLSKTMMKKLLIGGR